MTETTYQPAYIALGSNLERPLHQVTLALEEISQLPETELVARSRWYQSTALGPGNQPDYINGVAAIRTRLSPRSLLHRLQDIENAHGRIRAQRWGSRTLDLDILIYANRISGSPELTLPHPEIQNRNFVLLPLADVAPTLRFPDGRLLSSLLENCSTEGIVPLSEGE